MSQPNKQAPTVKEANKQLSPLQRKVRKLKRDPKQFVIDSKAYVGTRKAAYIAWAKFGSFALVLLASILVVGYYTIVASPRYATSTQFVVKEAGSNEAALMGIAALGTTSSAMRDALIIKEYVESREMAVSLDNAIELKAHYQNSQWDALSRLSDSATVEDYVEFYKKHISVRHDELSDIVHIEVQAFTPEYSLLLGQTLLEKSEQFINALGDKMAREQLAYAQKEVERLYTNMKNQQQQLVHFQNNNELYNPEQQGSAMLAAIGNLQGNIITAQAKLKEMLAVMRDDAAEVKSQRILIKSLQQQLNEEQSKLTSDDQKSLNQITANFQEIKLNTELSTGLYQAGLSSMEVVRADAYRKLKHLLIVQHPAQPETDQYPRRIYSIFTWFVSLLIVYLLGRLIWAIVKEHKE
ncbi:MAG: lipopolysaccharide biosynthesis protein [Gammaproteobacteria bacterium]|nr:lipopolysaccharide biosynthesis protein [Gammaproteobacteria bacterium]